MNWPTACVLIALIAGATVLGWGFIYRGFFRPPGAK